MTMRLVMPLVVASMVLSGCGKENKRITAEPVQQTDQGKKSTAAPDRPKKPSVRERNDQAEAARDREGQTPSKQSKADSATVKPPAEQKHAGQTGGSDSRKQAASVTPLDQSETEADLAITQRIRQALLREDLSFAAKNVLVITEADHLVIKGQVRSASEAERIKGIAGTITTKKIEDVLEVTP